MSEEECLLPEWNPEELKQISRTLADTLIHAVTSQPQETALTLATCVSGYEIVKEDQVVKVIRLDLIASYTAGVLDPLGQLRDWFISVFNSVASWIVSGIQTFINNYVLPAIGAVSSAVTSFIRDKVIPAITALATTITSAVSTFINNYVIPAIKAIPTAILDFINKNVIPILNSITSAITGIVSAVASAVSGAISGLATTISNLISGMAKTITDFISGAIKTVTDALGAIGKTITDAISGAISSITTAITGIVSTISSAITGIANTIIGAIANAISTISNAISGIVSTITGAISSFVSTISGIITSISSTIMGAISGLATTISNLISSISSSIISTISSFASMIVNAFQSIASGIMNAITGIVSAITGAIKNFIDIVTGALSKLSETITGAVKGIADTITGAFGKLWEFLVGAFQDIATKVGAGFQVIGNALMGFINGIIQAGQWIVNALQGIGTAIWNALPDWLRGGLTAIGNFFTAIVDGVKAFIADPLGWFNKNIIQPLMGALNWLWNALQGVWNWITSAIGKFGEWLWNGILSLGQGLVSLLSAGFKGLIDIGGKLIGGIRDILIKPILDLFNAVFTGLKDYITGMVERITKGTSEGEMAEALGLFGVIVSTQFTFRMISQALFWIGEVTSDWKLMPNVAIKILGAGGETTVEIPLKFGNVIKHLASEFRTYPDELMRGFFYGISIWITQPTVRCINSLFRNVLPIELPTVDVMVDATRRALPHKDFDKIMEKAKYFMSLYGYSDFVIDLYFKSAKEYSIEVTDRFGTKRAIPLSLMYQLPSASDVATMMVRDIFASIEDFQKLYLATGMEKEVGALYYFLRFRYPPPERLWQFTMRGISGLLWATLPDQEKADIKKEAESIGALMPVSPVTMNFKPSQLLTAFKTYMKWHDYARFCVVKGTVILGDNKPIEEYREGDHTLYGGKVLATFSRPYRSKVVKITAHGLLELKLTPEHIIPVITGTRKWVVVRENGAKKKKFTIEFSEPYYKHADEVSPAPKCRIQHKHSGDYILVPRLKGQFDIRELSLERYIKAKTNIRNHKLVLDEDLAWLLGFYVAEGHAQEKYVSFGQSVKHFELIEKLRRIIQKMGYSPVINKTRSVWEIYVKSPILSRAFAEWCGKGAPSKKIPDFILLHKNDRILTAFLNGYLAGDGYKDEDKQEKCCSTRSKVLAMQLQLALLRLEYISSIHKRKHENLFMVRFIPREHQTHLVWLFDDYALFPIHKVEYEDYEGTVYDLEVENSHYLVSNAIVHNSWIKDFPSDNLIYIDTLADIPMKIDQRWMTRFGIYEFLSIKDVKLDSPISDFRTKVIEASATSEVKLDLSNFCRTLQATGLHPDWVPLTAVAETINAITDERTLLRTGTLSLFKEGFWDIKSIEMVLAGAVTTSFQVAYFDISAMKWSTGWINMPLMFLPPERKLTELRAIMDRALDILREIQRDISTGYQEWIITDYKEYKERFTKVIENINTVFATDYKNIVGKELPKELQLQFVEEYYKPYVEALSIWRDVFTIRRVRMWTQRWLGWVMYRVAYGTVAKEDVEKLITYVSEKAKLTPYEAEFIKAVMELMYGISQRTATAEYLPTPSTLATLSEYITLPNDLVKTVLTERGLPEQWMNIWLTYIAVKPIKADAKTLLSTYVRGFRYGVVSKEKLEGFIKTLPQYGFTEKEVNFITESISIEEQILEAKATKAEYLPTPSTLATLSEYIVIPAELVEKTLKERAVPAEWAELWMQYIAVKPIKADAKALLSTYVRAFRYGAVTKEKLESFIKAMPSYGFTEKEIEFIMESVQLEEQILEAREYVPTPSTLASLSEYIVIPTEFIQKTFEARRIPKEWQPLWLNYISIRPIADDVKALLTAYRRGKVYNLIPEDLEKQILELAKTVGFTEKELSILGLRIQIEELIQQSREYIPTPSTLATICEIIPEARQFFDEVMTARRVPPHWQQVWAKYVDYKPIIDEIKKMLSRVESLYEYFAIEETDYKKVLESVKYLGWTDKEIEFMLSNSRYQRYLRAFRELIGDVDRMMTLAEYSPDARTFALGQLYKMIDAMPIDDATKKTLKAMWEQFIRLKPVKDEVTTYVRDIVNLYVEGLLSRADLEKELTWLKQWGLDDYEIQFWLRIADARRAKKLKIPVVYAE